MLETNVRNLLCHATIEHGVRQLAAARGEKSEQLNAEGQMLEQLVGNSVEHAAIQNGIAARLREEVEMIGESEIDVLLLPEMSRAE